MKRTFSISLLVMLNLLVSFSFNHHQQQIEKGKKLFYHCSGCHSETKSVTGAPFQRARQFYGKDWVYEAIRNWAALIAKDNKAKKLSKMYHNVSMTAFPNLSNSDIDAIMDYVDSFPYDPKNYKFRERL